MDHSNVILSLKGITKLFPGVIALKDVSVDFRAGEIHAIVGENGAGKSTLIKIITGYHAPDAGTVTVNGVEYPHGISPAESRAAGIEAVYQEYNLVDGLSAAENICLGRTFGPFVNYKKMRQVAQEIFDRFQIDIDPDTPVSDLTTAKMQIVEIAKAISKGASILIMDEPTAPLTVKEVEILMRIIQQLKSEGVTILYISHRLEEIFQICDRVSVFRDGQYIITKDVKDTSRQELIQYMVGRKLSESYPQRKTPPGDVVMELEKLTGNGVKNISLNVRKGEIVGLAGLVGAGRSEIMRVAYGAEHRQWGKILVRGEEVNIATPKDAMHYGIGFVPEDRKREGCFLGFGVEWNIVISCLKKISKATFVSRPKAKEIAAYYRDSIHIKTPSLEQPVMNLSGGNQQKIVVSKVLAAETEILIFDEPTRGIDVKAKHEIYELMNDLCAQGKAIIMISSDMEELLGMSDRIYVLCEKRMAGMVEKQDFSQEYILFLASGGRPQEYRKNA